MASIFCPSCGSKSEYQFAIPNFCSKCGKSYIENSKSNASIRPLSKKINSRIKNQDPEVNNDEFDDNDDEDVYNDEDYSNASRVPKISKIQVEIDCSTDVKVFKFDDLINGNLNNEFKIQKSRNINDLINE
jgi:hypothetical protein